MKKSWWLINTNCPIEDLGFMMDIHLNEIKVLQRGNTWPDTLGIGGIGRAAMNTAVAVCKEKSTDLQYIRGGFSYHKICKDGENV